MAYTKQTWQDLPSKTTPINASRLGHIEQGIYDAASTADTAASDASSAVSGLADKVDKVEGKGLSTNDFTDTLKTKLDNIESGAQVNVQSDWDEDDSSSDAFILNKPTLGTSAYKNSTSVVTQSTDLVESGAVESLVGWGNKNLLVYPYDDPTRTLKGVTFTVNADGSVTVNGTATDVAIFKLHLVSGNEKYIGKRVVLSGCPIGGSASTYFVNGYRASVKDGSSGTVQDIGNGVEFDFLNDGSGVKAEVQIVVMQGTTVNNLVFKPMIRLATITDNTYEPYHVSVEETLRDAEVIEGKNKLPYPFYETGTKTESNISIINNGDGTLSIGTSAQTSARVLYGLTGIGATTRRPISDIMDKILVLNATGNNFGLYLWYYNGSTYLSAEYISTNKKPTIPNNADSYVLFANVPSGTTPTGTIKPMIVDATETDYSFEPYYIPLKDVVPNKCDNSVIAPVEDGATASQAYAVDEHFIRNGAFCTVTSAISSGESLVGSSKFTSGDVAGRLGFLMNITPPPGGYSGDCNDLTAGMVYVGNSATNTPKPWSIIITFSATANSLTSGTMLQWAFPITNPETYYVRTKSGGTWSSWYKYDGTVVS